MSGLKIAKREGIVHLVGNIDEHSDLSELREMGTPLKLNFRNVKKINSVGIGKWIHFMKTSTNTEIEYHECTEIIIEAANVLPAFLQLNEKSKKIKSYQVPHFCGKCDKPAAIFVNDFEVEIGKERVKVPQKVCPECGSVLELDVDDDYFEFYFP